MENDESLSQYQEQNQGHQQYQHGDQAPYSQAPEAIPAKKKTGGIGFILGLISMIMFPVFYNPFMLWMVWIVAIFGLVYSIKGLRLAPKGLAIAGLFLSAFPLVWTILARFF